jgi:hypothetical protein
MPTRAFGAPHSGVGKLDLQGPNLGGKHPSNAGGQLRMVARHGNAWRARHDGSGRGRSRSIGRSCAAARISPPRAFETPARAR